MGGPQHGCAASLQWNLVLDHQFGPTLRPDSAAVGLVAVNTAFMGTPNSDLETIAFASRNGRASLVVFNQGNQERAFGVEDGKTRFNHLLPGKSLATLVW